MTGRFSVWSVGRDGNMDELLSFDSAPDALRHQRHMDWLYRLNGQVRKVGITDNESPESGDVSDRLAEKFEEGK